jgi:hypothetical protein
MWIMGWSCEDKGASKFCEEIVRILRQGLEEVQGCWEGSVMK